MQKFILAAILIGATVAAYAQNPKKSITYEYDAAGNRIARRVCLCTANFTNQTVATNTTVVACDSISVQQVSVNAVLTIKATGTITIKDGITFGNGGRLILDTQGSGRVIIDDKYDLSLGDFEIR